MRIILYIFHHQVLRLPETLLCEELFQLAVLCDKYGWLSVVKPHVTHLNWIEQHWEDMRPSAVDDDWCYWPLILATFSPDERRIQSAFDVISGNMYRSQDGKWVFGNSRLDLTAAVGIDIGQLIAPWVLN